MKKSTYLLLLSLCFSIIYAQENVDFSGEKKIISPEIHSDNTVTFRFEAPNVKKVFLEGDFLSQLGLIEGKTEMKKNEKGIWTYTTSTLQPELYSYKFIADGLAINDPNNVHFSRDVATVVNIFIVPGGKAELYKVNDVPHGTVSKRWYESPTLKMNRRLTVYTPPGYEKSKENYPVLYLLHGAGGDEEAWITLGRTRSCFVIHKPTSVAPPTMVASGCSSTSPASVSPCAGRATRTRSRTPSSTRRHGCGSTRKRTPGSKPKNFK